LKRDTFKFGEVRRLHFFSVFDFLCGLCKLGFIVDGKLPDHVLFGVGFMFEVRDVVFGDFLDDVVVGERFALLEDGALVSAHWILFEVSWVTDKLLLTTDCCI
jgi:hypothetical protein